MKTDVTPPARGPGSGTAARCLLGSARAVECPAGAVAGAALRVGGRGSGARARRVLGTRFRRRTRYGKRSRELKSELTVAAIHTTLLDHAQWMLLQMCPTRPRKGQGRDNRTQRRNQGPSSRAFLTACGKAPLTCTPAARMNHLRGHSCESISQATGQASAHAYTKPSMPFDDGMRDEARLHAVPGLSQGGQHLMAASERPSLGRGRERVRRARLLPAEEAVVDGGGEVGEAGR